ncbi:AraC family transcriptional regulator [Flammeovirga sp. EKP202]|uniref:helix-turn-helix domain-containing protein n=1 Tax=Flammeovirga sp. EKP202 TaxID=2770592 RepID=UPI00165ED1F9|nr:helix-turn-helix domain-containing protein [Flammeovirga sp. EKP202]MBD0405306.1 helix-turn-helix transcriptional regulator [Flammeovirga sp. EKP202]
MTTYYIKSISELHSLFGFPAPKHPLISLIDASQIQVLEKDVGSKVIYDFYMISLKDRSCGVEYGRNSFDFDEGLMVFSSPGQVYMPTKPLKKGDIQGWMLYFHQDLIRNTHLGKIISDFTFFNYDIVEALHLSEDEERTINGTVQNIESEYSQRIDNHSQRVIVSNLELLLTYCYRFYERQFNTRSIQCKGVISQFEKEIKKYFKTERHLDSGLPSVEHFANIANLSQHYFSDLIKKETGRKPKDHINQFVIEEAKNLLVGTEQSVSEIAYDLGFRYPHYFTRLFKSKTGHTPIEFRNLN